MVFQNPFIDVERQEGIVSMVLGKNVTRNERADPFGLRMDRDEPSIEAFV